MRYVKLYASPASSPEGIVDEPLGIRAELIAAVPERGVKDFLPEDHDCVVV